MEGISFIVMSSCGEELKGKLKQQMGKVVNKVKNLK